MASHRIAFTVKELVAAPDHGEALARALAAGVSYAMSASFGAVDLDGRKLWTAHDWQDDGSFVHLSVDPSTGSIDLALDTRGLERPQKSPRWVWPLLVTLLMTSAALAVWRRSLLVGGVAAVASIGGWLALDVWGQIVRERRRVIDPAAWEQRLERSVELALERAPARETP